MRQYPENGSVPYGRAAELFKLLGDRTRLRLVHQLVCRGEASAGELSSALGLRAPALSNQLRLLTDSGIVASRRVRTTIIYRIINPHVGELLALALRWVGADHARRSHSSGDASIRLVR